MNLYHKTGVKFEDTTFLFTDNQIVQEEFLEDINCILNSGKLMFGKSKIGMYRFRQNLKWPSPPSLIFANINKCLILVSANIPAMVKL